MEGEMTNIVFLSR